MKTITRVELKSKLDRGADIKLVFAMGEWHYRNMHIPGSMYITSLEKALKFLRRDDEIVVYCSNIHCRDSIYAYHYLINHGYTKVSRYSGGLEDWVAAGYPVHRAHPTPSTAPIPAMAA